MHFSYFIFYLFTKKISHRQSKLSTGDLCRAFSMKMCSCDFCLYRAVCLNVSLETGARHVIPYNFLNVAKIRNDFFVITRGGYQEGWRCLLSGLQNYRLMCCFKICNVPIGCSNRELIIWEWGRRPRNASVGETEYAGCPGNKSSD